jgi:hypothetical protein
MDVVALALRWWIVLVCLAAVVGKLRGRAAVGEFGAMLVAIRVPPRLVLPVGAAIIGAELLVVGLGPWPRTGVAGMAVAVALFAVFTAGVARAVRHRVTAPCRCFGGGGGQLSTVHVVRNAVLTAVAAVAGAVSAITADSVTLAAAVIGVLAAGVAAALIVRWEDLAALFVDPPAAPR